MRLASENNPVLCDETVTTLKSVWTWARFPGFYYIFEHNRTPSGKKTVTGVQVISASQVQSISCRWQALSSGP